eukprot:SAG22_NODE_455_length_10287_cov_1276.978406_1_plen_294_part_00
MSNGTVWFARPSTYFTNVANCSHAPGRPNLNGFISVLRAESLDAALEGNLEQMPITYELAGAATRVGKLSPTGNSSICFNWEDLNLWIDKRGHLHSFHHAWSGSRTDLPAPTCSNDRRYYPCQSRGGHAFSVECVSFALSRPCCPLFAHIYADSCGFLRSSGRHWYISPDAMYLGNTLFADGSNVTWRARERPHVLQNAELEVIALSNGVGDPNPPQCQGGNTGCPNHDHTFTLIQPVRTKADDDVFKTDEFASGRARNPLDAPYVRTHNAPRGGAAAAIRSKPEALELPHWL